MGYKSTLIILDSVKFSTHAEQCHNGGISIPCNVMIVLGAFNLLGAHEPPWVPGFTDLYLACRGQLLQ